MDQNFSSPADFLQEMVRVQQIPGAVYAVVNEKQTLTENAVGYAHLGKKIPMQLDTLFDLASLTKVCATLPSILLLVERGVLDFDDPVRRFFPEEENGSLTLKHLLTHTSGFPPSVPFYQYHWSKEQILGYILSLDSAPGQKVVYSDLNFMLLGFLVEKLTKRRLDVFTREHIYQPLKMNHTGFNPDTDLSAVAATEWLPEQQRYQWGKVHDENANYLGGVSGHAGLFSDLHDLKIYVQMLLNRGRTENGDYFLSPAMLQASERNYTRDLGASRGFGWQLMDDQSPAGYFLSERSFGHTGFTGTSFWIDPERRLGFILLSNRVHISRRINMNRIRRIFNNLFMSDYSRHLS
ncbi:serine hydrolase domain-containing protein [Sporolactobacillus vineae]|uniref:serine hydrolase domain-containing protein n=1 Tax=Sporolactobacillus vineae TaxID=444463 RepID=UPI000288388E|nr:serine hydrolase domain-containing protein [Sporolactobacillus vineae]